MKEINIFIFVYIFATLLLSSTGIIEKNRCKLILKYSKALDEIGVYAAKKLTLDDLLEISIGITIPYSALYWNPLVNYCEGYNDTHALILLGNGMLYNHVPSFPESSLRKVMSDFPGFYNHGDEHGLSKDILMLTNFKLKPGEQVLSYYGDDWFSLRNLSEIYIQYDSNNTQDDLITLPGCFYNFTEIKDNKIEAIKLIEKGTIIEVSRVILVEENEILRNTRLASKFFWWNPLNQNSKRKYTIQDPHVSPYHIAPFEKEKKYAILISGYGSLYGSMQDISSNQTLPSLHNVDYEWYFIEHNTNGKVQCSNLMMMSFKANRRIFPGEEIILDTNKDKINNLIFYRKDLFDICD